jgi:K+-transporting ATPase ATPase A chain
MLLGRFGLAVPALALAARVGAQSQRATSSGTLPTDTPIFGGVIVGTVLIVGALTYFAVLALGPVIEQLVLNGVR